MPPKRPQTLVETSLSFCGLSGLLVTVLVISLCLAIICAFCESCILGLEIQRYFSNRPEMLLVSYTHHQWQVVGLRSISTLSVVFGWVRRDFGYFGDSWLMTSDAKGEPRDRRVTSKSRRDCSCVLSVCVLRLCHSRWHRGCSGGLL